MTEGVSSVEWDVRGAAALVVELESAAWRFGFEAFGVAVGLARGDTPGTSHLAAMRPSFVIL